MLHVAGADQSDAADRRPRRHGVRHAGASGPGPSSITTLDSAASTRPTWPRARSYGLSKCSATCFVAADTNTGRPRSGPRSVRAPVAARRRRVRGCTRTRTARAITDGHSNRSPAGCSNGNFSIRTGETVPRARPDRRGSGPVQ